MRFVDRQRLSGLWCRNKELNPKPWTLLLDPHWCSANTSSWCSDSEWQIREDKRRKRPLDRNSLPWLTSRWRRSTPLQFRNSDSFWATALCTDQQHVAGRRLPACSGSATLGPFNWSGCWLMYYFVRQHSTPTDPSFFTFLGVCKSSLKKKGIDWDGTKMVTIRIIDTILWFVLNPLWPPSRRRSLIERLHNVLVLSRRCQFAPGCSLAWTGWGSPHHSKSTRLIDSVSCTC